jgi:hypothetical protein
MNLESTSPYQSSYANYHRKYAWMGALRRAVSLHTARNMRTERRKPFLLLIIKFSLSLYNHYAAPCGMHCT